MELPEGESFQIEIIDHGKEERDKEFHHFFKTTRAEFLLTIMF
jgi:hypothetical protein